MDTEHNQHHHHQHHHHSKKDENDTTEKEMKKDELLKNNLKNNDNKEEGGKKDNHNKSRDQQKKSEDRHKSEKSEEKSEVKKSEEHSSVVEINKQHHDKPEGDQDEQENLDKDENDEQSQNDEQHQSSSSKNNENESKQQQQQEYQEHEFQRIQIIDWSTENTKQWIQCKKSIGTQNDKDSDTSDFENRNGVSLLEISKSKDTFKSYAGDSKHDRAFASLLYDDLKEKVENLSKQKLKKDIVNRVAIIRILKKKYMIKHDLVFGSGLRVGRDLILTSSHLMNGIKEGGSTLIEVGFDGQWFKSTILNVSSPEESNTDCALLQIKDLQDKFTVETYPIATKGYELLKDVICCSFPYTRLPMVSPSDHKNFSTVVPPEPSLYYGHISHFNDDTLEISLSGDPGVCKGGLIFNLNCGELCAIIKKQPNSQQSVSGNVLFCTRYQTISAWVNTALKKLQQPPLWE
ncbi:hypothetical protein ACTFIY_003311 [Dictyostelium cf. discoideum]